MSKTETNYRAEASSDADEMVRNFQETIVQMLLDDGEASDDINNDYSNGDAYHHETHVDRAYRLLEAAELLDQLDDYEEDDPGLWDGQDPRDAIATQAAYTYGNAVASMWSDRIRNINYDMDIQEIVDTFQAIEDPSDDAETAAKADLAARIDAILKA